MRRTLEEGYELDDDPARLDLVAIWAFLSTEAYWGRARTRELFERQVRGAARVMGLYHRDEQVGFERHGSPGRGRRLKGEGSGAAADAAGGGLSPQKLVASQGPVKGARVGRARYQYVPVCNSMGWYS